MKKYLVIFLALITVVSCTKLEELNEDTKNPTEVPAALLFANAQKELMDRMTSPNVNYNNFRLWAQQWTQTTYTEESNYELDERSVNTRMYTLAYAEVLRDLKDARALIEENEQLLDQERAAQLAMIEVMSVLTYHIMVDIFGNIPYSEALGDDVTPKYDDDREIYYDLVDRLNAAIPGLAGASSGFGAGDLIYQDDLSKWRKFANSLKLRLAQRIAEVDDAKARQMVQEAVNAGVMTSPADNFALDYLGATPNTNPLWEDLIQSGRTDFIAANTIADIMNALDDPRRDNYFKDLDSVGNVIGGVYGRPASYSGFSHPGLRLEDPTEPGVLMSYTEVLFLLADFAARGYAVPNTAEEYYHSGIRYSILYWDGTNAEADAYIAQPDVNWNTAPGDWREKIGTQKWLALWNRGFEAWTTWRLYDAPDLNIADLAQTLPPLRFTYPVEEFSLNAENVNMAAGEFNANSLYAPLFWDK